MRKRSSGWRDRRRERHVAWVAVLALVAGCSGGANPVNRLKARLQLKEGNLSYLDGRYEEAIRSYDTALRYVPRLAPASLHRAYSQEALSRTSGSLPERQRLATEAVRSFETYLSLIEHGAVGSDEKAPGRGRVEEHILTLLIESEQIDQAIAHLQARHERDPRDASALELLSRLEMDRGNLDAALVWQRKRMEAEPQDPDALYSLGAFVWLMSYRDPGMDRERRLALLDEGLASLRRAIEIRPDDFETLIYINLLYLEKAKYVAGEAERSEFEAQSRAFRERALALRKTTAPDSTDLGPETP